MKKTSSSHSRRSRMVLAVEPLEDRRVLSLGLGSLASAAGTSLVSLQLPNLIAPVIVTTQPSVVTPNTGTGSAGVVTTPTASAGPALSNLASSLLDSLLPTVAPINNALPATPTFVSSPAVTVPSPASNLFATVTNALAPVFHSLTVTPVTASIPLPLNIGLGTTTSPSGPTLSLLSGLLPSLGHTLTPLLGTLTNTLTGTLLGTGNTASGGLIGELLGSVSGVLSPLLSTVDNSVAALLNNLPLLSSLGIGVGLTGGNGNPTTLSVTLPLLSVNLSLAPLPVPAVTAIVGVNAGPPSSGPGAPLPPITVTVSGNAGDGSQSGGGTVTVTIGPAGSDNGTQLPPSDGGNPGTTNPGLDPVSIAAPGSVAATDAGTLLHDVNGVINASPTAPVSQEQLGLFFAGQGDEQAEANTPLLGVTDALNEQAVLTTLFTTPQPFDGALGTDVLPANQTTTAISSGVVGPTGAAVPATKEQGEALTFLADGDRLADGTAFNLVTLEQEVQQFLSQLNNLHHDLGDLLATFGLSPWMFGLAVAAVVGLEGRRRLRRRKTTLAEALAGDDAALPWYLHCERMLAAEQT